MKALKALVAVMGILILAGIGLVIYGVLTQFGPGGDEASSVAETAPVVAPPLDDATPGAGAIAPRMEPAAAQSFGDIVLAEPESTEIADVSVSDRHIILRLTGGGLPDRIVVLRAADGTRLGTIRLNTDEGQ